MNHRGLGPVPAHTYAQLSARSGQMVCENPYPCEMDLGMLEGIAERFLPKDSLRVQVTHVPGECRRQQAERCTYLIHW
jgi:hypothetical protein